MPAFAGTTMVPSVSLGPPDPHDRSTTSQAALAQIYSGDVHANDDFVLDVPSSSNGLREQKYPMASFLDHRTDGYLL
jgi:hypothetical protein